MIAIIGNVDLSNPPDNPAYGILHAPGTAIAFFAAATATIVMLVQLGRGKSASSASLLVISYLLTWSALVAWGEGVEKSVYVMNDGFLIGAAQFALAIMALVTVGSLTGFFWQQLPKNWRETTRRYRKTEAIKRLYNDRRKLTLGSAALLYNAFVASTVAVEALLFINNVYAWNIIENLSLYIFEIVSGIYVIYLATYCIARLIRSTPFGRSRDKTATMEEIWNS